MSNCRSPVLLNPSFLRTMESVNVSMLSLFTISNAFGCGGASATCMKLEPFPERRVNDDDHRGGMAVRRIRMLCVEKRRKALCKRRAKRVRRA